MSGLMTARRGVIARRADSPPPGNFVTRDPVTGNLMLDGQRFRFGGNNAPTIAYDSTHAQIDEIIADTVAMKGRTIRAWGAVLSVGSAGAVQPTIGVFNAAALEPVDYFLQQCNIYGIRAILPLVDNYDFWPHGKAWYALNTGGGDSDNFYTRTAAVDAFTAHISFVLNHVNQYTGIAYKADAAVLAFETGNELSSNALTDAQWRTWMTTVTAHIKTTEAAQQLLMDGVYGFWNDPAWCALDWDIASDHTYDNTRTPAYLANEGSLAHAAGKAFFVGEFGIYDAPQTNWTLDQLLSTVEDSPYIDGTGPWAFKSSSESSDSFTFYYPGTSPNMQQRVGMITDHSARMAVITPKAFVSESFTGSNGTALSSHVGEVGATWDFNDSWAGVGTIGSNRLWFGSTESHYFASGVPASADYTVSADIYIASLLSGSYAGVAARSFTTYHNYSYICYVWYSGGVVGVYIDYYRDGLSLLNQASVTIPAPLALAGSTHNLKFKVEGSSLSAYWDDAPVIAPVTNASLAFAGRAGVVGGGAGSSSTGFHIENVTAIDRYPTPAVPPMLRIPNRYVGPMALRNQFRRSTQPIDA